MNDVGLSDAVKHPHRSDRALLRDVLLTTPAGEGPFRVRIQPTLCDLLPLHHAAHGRQAVDIRPLLGALARRGDHAKDKYKLNHNPSLNDLMMSADRETCPDIAVGSRARVVRYPTSRTRAGTRPVEQGRHGVTAFSTL